MIDMVSYLERMPESGETVRGRSFSLGFGGKGANQAIMAALLGGRISMVACVGDDVFADLAIDNLAAASIDTSCVTRCGEAASGVAPIWVEPSGDNRIVIAPGANDLLSARHVDEAFQRLPPPDVVLCQLEIGQEAVRRAFEHARCVGATTILNPAPAAALDPRILELTTWLVPNEQEFACVRATLDGDSDSDQIQAAVVAIAERWHVGIVVTVGADGALLYSEVAGAVRRTPAPPTVAADTTGAGDAFVGAFAHGLAAGHSPLRAVELGCACAASSVARLGTQTSFPRAGELAGITAAWRARTGVGGEREAASVDEPAEA